MGRKISIYLKKNQFEASENRLEWLCEDMRDCLPNALRKLLFCLSVVSALLTGWTLHSEPFYADLSGVANSAMEDDGIADNGTGGWTDEGINDMFVYPPVPKGVFSRNGYHFKILDAEKQLIVLRGASRCKDNAEEVKIPIPGIKSQFVYFLQNSAAQPKGEAKNYLVAEYTVKYADGSSVQIPIRDDIEIKQWYNKEWWNNSGEAAWPILMGQNLYSMKWHMFIGVWAMQWKNPHPEKAIAEIVLKSACKSVPVIWAVTLDDQDYFKSPDIKKDFLRPESAPPSYFSKKEDIENKRLFDAMVKCGHVKGVREIRLLRPDLIAVDIDSAIVGGAGMGAEKSAKLQSPEHFTISSSSDADFPDGSRPEKVGRHSWKFDTVSVMSFPNNHLYWHTYYLKLKKPLKLDNQYRVSVSGIPNGFANDAVFSFSKETQNPAIKVNQSAYSSKASQRFAYLGWWAGDLGALDFDEFDRFAVIDRSSGKTSFEGKIVPRVATGAEKNTLPESEVSGEKVYEIDFSGFNAPGSYQIEIPGLGRSCEFRIGPDGVRENYRTVMRGFLFQRCGCELDSKVCNHPRHACHLKNYESGALLYGVNEKYEDGKPVLQNKPEKAGEPVKEFKGGYHDAGDFDLFYSHLIAPSKMIIAYEFCPEAFKDNDLNIPESGNGVPDILDEAEWGLKFYADEQLDDGAILSGRGNGEDYSYKEWKNEFKKWKESRPDWKKYGDLPPYGNFFPCSASSNTFAAVASQLSRALQKIDPEKSKMYLDKAEKAYQWAKKHQEGYEAEGISYGKIELKKAWIWAASELFKTTGKKEYGDDVITLANDKETLKSHWNQAYSMPFYQWAYASCPQTGTDQKIKDKFVEAICKSADSIVKNSNKRAYRMGSGRETGGWGSLVGGGYYADTCILAYMLTKDKKYLDSASFNADYQLGANPLSRSFITGLGARPPLHPELRAWLYNERGPCEGISVYGPGGNVKSLGDVYPDSVPLWRCWLDNRVAAMHSEFTVASSMAESALLYGALWAIENRQ